jgi:hypothetical protein
VEVLIGLTLRDVFLIFNVILPWEVSIGTLLLGRQVWIHKSPVPVPTGITTSFQAGREGKSSCIQGPIYWKISPPWEGKNISLCHLREKYEKVKRKRGKMLKKKKKRGKEK